MTLTRIPTRAQAQYDNLILDLGDAFGVVAAMNELGQRVAGAWMYDSALFEGEYLPLRRAQALIQIAIVGTDLEESEEVMSQVGTRLSALVAGLPKYHDSENRRTLVGLNDFGDAMTEAYAKAIAVKEAFEEKIDALLEVSS